LALGLAAINQFFSLLDPQIFRIIVDKYASHFRDYETKDFLTGVSLLLLASVGVAFVSRVAKNFQDYYVHVITQKLGAEMYASSVSHAFSLPFSHFEDQRSGELLKKLDKARIDAQALVTSAINVLFLSLIGIAFVVVYAFIVHPAIGTVYLLMIPTLLLITFGVSRKIKKAQERIVKEVTALSGSTTETIRNVELVKSLGLESQEISRLNTVNQTILQLELQKIVLIRKMSFVQGTTINAIRSLLLLLMMWLIVSGSISLGQFFSLFIYSFFIFNPLSELPTVATQLQESRASMEQLENILATEASKKPKEPIPFTRIESIRAEKMGFSYQSSPLPALTDVSFSLQKGKTFGFVGPSGSGKTTIIKLLSGLYQPTQGGIWMNDAEFSSIDMESYRKRIGLVSQDTQLFAGTIRDNLLFVRPQASDDDCIRVLRSAAAEPLLRRDSQGLDTRIGEGGIKLSGGEKQRLAIARALLRQPDLMLFDEATSSLDSITEKSITETIREITRMHQDAITVIVAHRLSTVAHADEIYVLEKGRIVEHGNHETLLRFGGLYAALWREQSSIRGT